MQNHKTNHSQHSNHSILLAILFFLFSYNINAQPLIEWSEGLGGTLNDIPQAVRATTDGGYIITGQSNSSDINITNSFGDFDMWVTKLDENGNLDWQKNYGGSSGDYALDVQLTNDGGYILTGGTASSDNDLSTNNGAIDLWILKIDANGEVEWSNTFGGSGVDLGSSIQVLSDGYMIAGSTSSAGEPGVAAGYGGNEFWILKVDLDGELLWEKTYGGKRHDAAKSIFSTDDGGYIIAGNTWSKDGDINNNHGHSDAWVIKTDNDGNLQWSQTYGSTTPDRLNSFEKTNDGNYILAGVRSELDLVVDGFFGRYDEQFWILKLNPNGQELWSKTYGGNEYDEATTVASTIDGGYIVGGWVRSTDSLFTSQQGNKDAWMVKTDSNGNKEWFNLLGGAENETIQSIIETNDGGYLMLGFSNSIFVDTLFVKKGYEDWWVVKYGGSFVNVNLGADITVCKDADFTLDAYLPNCSCTYMWNDGSTDSIRTISISETTPFSVTVTDADGLEGIDQINVFVSEPQVDKNIVDVPCFDFPSGSIGLVPYGAYTYQWSTGATTQDIYNVNAGTYTYTVTDGNQCSIVGSATVNEPDAITIAEDITEVDCYGNNTGAIDIAISGGVGNFEYQWSTGDSIQDINNLTTGGYTVTITDDNGCIKVQDWVVTEPAAIDLASNIIPLNCFDSEDGGSMMSINGGAGNFEYEWSNGDTTKDLLGVGTGTYTLTVTDGNNCTNFIQVDLTAPDEILITETIQNSSCAGNNDGTITTNVSGGEGLYTFNWSNGQTTPNLSQLSSGTYTLTVTDGNNCEKIKEIVVSQTSNITLTSQIVLPLCHDSQDGSINITPSGGSGNLSYKWSIGDETPNVDELTAGTYVITITDGIGCEYVELFNIDAPDSIVINSIVTDILCNNGSDGAIQVNANGGTGNLEYNWIGLGTDATTINNLTADDYSVVVTDNNGCTELKIITVEEPLPIAISNINITPVSCFGLNDGSIDIDVIGGTGPYNMQWVGGANSNLFAGDYTVSITDANNCNNEFTFFIPEPDSLEISFQVTNPNNGDDGSIITNVVGGTMPYEYNWNNGMWLDSDISELAPGTYDLVLTDFNGCMIEGSVSLSPVGILEIENLQTFEIYPNPNDGNFFLKLEFEQTEEIEISITNELGQVLQTYNRTGTQILEENNFDRLTSGIYFVMIKTENGVAVKRVVVQR